MSIGFWICVVTNGSIGSQSLPSFEASIRNVFGSDLLRVCLIGETGSGEEDSYVLINCLDYNSHSEALRCNKRISKVLESFDNPRILSDEDVKGLVEKAPEPSREFIPGDVVKITSGCMSGLTGIVTRQKSKKRYHVFFRFHTRSFQKIILSSSMEFKFNLFKVMNCSSPSETVHSPVMGMKKEDMDKIRSFLLGEIDKIFI